MSASRVIFFLVLFCNVNISLTSSSTTSMSTADTSTSMSTADTNSSMSTADTSTSISTADTSTSMSTADTSTSMSTADTSTSMSTTDTSTSISTADTSTSMSTADTSTSMSTADTSTSMSTADTGTSISTADTSTSMSTADTSTSMSTTDTSTSISTAGTSTSMSTADTSTSMSTADTSTSMSTADTSIFSNTDSNTTSETTSDSTAAEATVDGSTPSASTGESNATSLPPDDSTTEEVTTSTTTAPTTTTPPDTYKPPTVHYTVKSDVKVIAEYNDSRKEEYMRSFTTSLEEGFGLIKGFKSVVVTNVRNDEGGSITTYNQVGIIGAYNRKGTIATYSEPSIIAEYSLTVSSDSLGETQSDIAETLRSEILDKVLPFLNWTEIITGGIFDGTYFSQTIKNESFTRSIMEPNCQDLTLSCALGYVCDIITNVPMCMSRCRKEDVDCSGNGVCTLESATGDPKCRCNSDDAYVFTGENCEIRTERFQMARADIITVGVAVAGTLLLILGVISITLYTKLRKAKRRSLYNDFQSPSVKSLSKGKNSGLTAIRPHPATFTEIKDHSQPLYSRPYNSDDDLHRRNGSERDFTRFHRETYNPTFCMDEPELANEGKEMTEKEKDDNPYQYVAAEKVMENLSKIPAMDKTELEEKTAEIRPQLSGRNFPS